MSKKFSAQRKRAFLSYLAESGNQTLSAERAKVSRSWVCLHRKSDAEFDGAVREAIERARERLLALPPHPSPLRGSSLSREGRGADRWRWQDGVELVARGTGGHGGGKRVQIGRARVKQWTPRTEQRFLTALSATCNVKAACAEVGLWPPSAYNHRKRRPGFAQAWDEAIETGYVAIEAALVEAAFALFHPPEHELGFEPAGQIQGMSVAAAIHILHMNKHKLFRLGKAPGLKSRMATPEEVEKELGKAVGRLGSWMKREGIVP